MCLLSSICSSVSVSGVSHVLLITQRLGRVDLRRLPGGQVGGQERGGVADDHHEQQRTPRHGVFEAGDVLADVVYECARETEAQSYPYADTEQGYEGRLDQEHKPHLTPLEAQGSHHADLLTPLDHRARGYDAERGNPDHEPETHEAPEQEENDPPRRVVVPDHFSRDLRLQAVFCEVSLQRLSCSCGVDSATEVEIVCLGRHRTAGQSFEHILGGYDVPSKGGRPYQDPDYAQVPRLAGLGVFYPEVEVFGQILVVGVEASELHGRLH